MAPFWDSCRYCDNGLLPRIYTGRRSEITRVIHLSLESTGEKCTQAAHSSCERSELIVPVNFHTAPRPDTTALDSARHKRSVKRTISAVPLLRRPVRQDTEATHIITTGTQTQLWRGRHSLTVSLPAPPSEKVHSRLEWRAAGEHRSPHVINPLTLLTLLAGKLLL